MLDRIIHFKALGPDGVPFRSTTRVVVSASPWKPDLVTLYSDKNLRFTDHIYLRLADYKEAMESLANDDLLVGHYLLRQAVTLMGKTENIQEPRTRAEEIPHNDLRRSVYELIANSWEIVYSLERNSKVQIEPEPFDCFEDPYDGRAKRYDRITTWTGLIDGYMEKWIFAPFNPSKVDVEGSDIYCMFLSAKRFDDKEGLTGLALPFSTISTMFAGVGKQIAEALAQRD